MTSIVWHAALTAASKAWSDQADELYAAKKCLSEISPALLGPNVGPVAATFITTWSNRVQSLRTHAEAHAESLSLAALNWNSTDLSNQEDLRNLLPWDARNLDPGSGPSINMAPTP